ncbi:MAG: Wzz/FepE/Etk N-terminal domain-containing protein [Candidatus Zixiibacteriota bacterium]
MDDARKFNLWTMLLVIARRKVFIISLVAVCTVAAVVVALMLPKWYRAKTSMLPSQHDQLTGLTGNFAQYAMSSAGFDLPMMATASDVYATMLKSETISRAVTDRLNLKEYLKLDSYQKCHNYLRENVDIKVTPEGIVELYCLDKDPQMAADMANEYVRQLDLLNRNVKAAKAKSDREFVFNRLDSTKTILEQARDRLLDFQMTHKAVDLVSQKNLAITAATELKTQLALARVERDVKKKSLSATHPTVVSLDERISQLENQITSLETGTGDDTYLNLPLSEIPALTIKLAQLEADVKLQEEVYSLLTELYEEARIKEQKDTPTIAVLETAYPPDLKYKPKRSIIVAGALFGSLCLAIFIALFADYLENLRRTSPTDFDIMRQARDELSKKRYTD